MPRLFIFVSFLLSINFSFASEQKDFSIIERSFVNPVRIVAADETSATNDVFNILLKPRYGQIPEGRFMEGSGPELPKGAWAVFDFGCELHGSIQIGSGLNSGTQAIVRVRLGESVAEAMSEFGERGSGNDHAIRDDVIRLPRLGRREFGESGFRFVRIDNVGECPVQLEYVRAVSLMRRMEQIGFFRCSDDRLNRIWETAVRTVHLCCQDYIWDGIKRDRLVWMGDTHPETKVILNVFGADGIIPKTLDYAAQTTSPSSAWMNGMPTYTLWWIRNLAEWYRFTGDVNYLSKQSQYLIRTVERVLNAVGDDGLWMEDAFLDWPTCADKTAEKAGVQGLLLMAIDDSFFLLDEIGRIGYGEDMLKRLKSRILSVRERVVATRCDPKGVKTAAAMLSISGLRDSREMFVDVIGKNGYSGVSTFYGYYMLEAMGSAGEIQYAIDTIRNYWGGMLDMGATSFWEDFNLAWTNNAFRIDEKPIAGKRDIHGDFGDYCYKGFRHSLCHGWSAGPASFCINHVLGLRSRMVGCREIEIKPFLGDLDWAEGAMALPTGESVKVIVRKSSNGNINVDVEAPEWVKVYKVNCRK